MSGLAKPIKYLRDQLTIFWSWLFPKSRQLRRLRLYQYKDFCFFVISAIVYSSFSRYFENLLIVDLSDVKKMMPVQQ